MNPKAGLRGGVSETPSAIQEIVAKKSIEWCRQLMDFTRRNRLLFYKQLKRGTLDLSQAEPTAVSELLQGSPVTIAKLFPARDAEAIADIHSRIRTVIAKDKENYEERSIRTLRLAVNQVTWDDSESSTSKNTAGTYVPPSAPLLLVPVEISTRQGRTDYAITALVDACEVNPVLVQYLRAEFAFDLTPPDSDSQTEEQSLSERLADLAIRIKDLRGGRVVTALNLANFAYAKLAMVEDIREDQAAMASHKVIQALCGVKDAIEAIRGHYVDPPLDAPNRIPPADEYLILDADSSQNRIINAILDQRTFAFDGPPGTGKSQTIANAIAALVARGKSVLFVAEKRAAIDVVLSRLSSVGLGDVVMDYHGTGHKKKELLDKIRSVLPAVGRLPSQLSTDPPPGLQETRTFLVESSENLHSKIPGLELSLYDLLALRSHHELRDPPSFVLPAADQMSLADVRSIEQELDLMWTYGGFLGGSGAALWRDLSDVDKTTIHKTIERLQVCEREVLDDLSAAEGILVEVFGRSTTSSEEKRTRLEVFGALYELQKKYGTQLFKTDTSHIEATLADLDGFIKPLLMTVISRNVRKARRELQQLAGTRLSPRAMARLIKEIAEAKISFHSASDDLRPIPNVLKVAGSEQTSRAWKKFVENEEYFTSLWGEETVCKTSLESTEQLVRELLLSTQVALALKEASRQETKLRNQGFDRLVEIARDRGLSLDSIRSALWLGWVDPIIARYSSRSTVSKISGFDDLDSAASGFRQLDQEHLRKTPSRILDTWRKNYQSTIKNFDNQEKTLSTNLNRKRNIPTLSQIFRDSQQVICAIKPVWVMSPLSVSMLRPRAGSFDVVIFDEASQILPWDAVTAIKAAQQVVVAGDDQQLPPTTFFAGSERDEENDEDAVVRDDDLELRDFESILAFVKSVVTKPMQLQWHYRSRDERLIHYSNAKIYRSLTTFADSSREQVLTLRKVPLGRDAVSRGASNVAEVTLVCDLVKEHSHSRPSESLGVIALGNGHADAIELELHRRREEDPDLDRYLSVHEGEQFFVKNLERVQGDERDAIILSVGYGRGPDLQMRYTFGPINGKYGVRRLNVATTRARNRLTLVATFSATDLAEEMCSTGGLEFLRGYMKFVEMGGTGSELGEEVPEMNAFEKSIFDRLVRAGLDVVPQYGVGSYRIDFAIRSRSNPSRFALAVECDGASYHSQPTARDRDRLRQSALERRGWKFCRVWSTDWFNNPDRCLDEILERLSVAEKVT